PTADPAAVDPAIADPATADPATADRVTEAPGSTAVPKPGARTGPSASASASARTGPSASPAGESGPGRRANPGIEAPTDPLIGAVLGGCKIQRLLGRGAMGSVYEATQVNLDRT